MVGHNTVQFIFQIFYIDLLYKACQLISFLLTQGFDINLYGMKRQNGMYLFGLIDRATLPSTEDDASTTEDIYILCAQGT